MYVLSDLQDMDPNQLPSNNLKKTWSPSLSFTHPVRLSEVLPCKYASSQSFQYCTSQQHSIDLARSSYSDINSVYSRIINVNHVLSRSEQPSVNLAHESSRPDHHHQHSATTQCLKVEKNSQVSVASDSTASSPDANSKAAVLHLKAPQQSTHLSDANLDFPDLDNQTLNAYDEFEGSLAQHKGEQSISSSATFTNKPSESFSRHKIKQRSLPLQSLPLSRDTDLPSPHRHMNFRAKAIDMLRHQNTLESDDMNDPECLFNTVASLKKPSCKFSTPKQESSSQYTFQSPSSGTVLNRGRQLDQHDATDTLRSLINSLSQYSSLSADQDINSATPQAKHKSKSSKRQLNVTFSNVVSKQSPDYPITLESDTGIESGQYGETTPTQMMGADHPKGMLLESFFYFLDENQSTNGAATAPAAMMSDAETMLASLLDSLGTSETPKGPSHNYPERSSPASSSYEKQLTPPGSDAQINHPTLDSKYTYTDQEPMDTYTYMRPCETLPSYEHKSQPSQYTLEAYSKSLMSVTRTNGDEISVLPICMPSPYDHPFMCQSQHEHLTSYTSPLTNDHHDEQNLYPYLHPKKSSSCPVQYVSKYNQASYSYCCPSTHVATTSSQMYDSNRSERYNKLYADDRDRMIYVSWIPKRARAYNDTDKRRMELELKHRLREQLSFSGLIKVLLFPPKGVHCKLIFNSRKSAASFMEIYGGDTRSQPTEKWKEDLCRIYDIDMRDKFDKTVVKIEWSQK